MKHSPTPKLYYSIKEVGELFDEEQHILRYWEREFDILRPQKNRAGNRVYTERDIRILRVIKKLLRQDRISVAVAKEMLKSGIPENLDDIANQPIEQQFRQPEKASAAPNGHGASARGGTVKLNRSDVTQLIDLLGDISNLINKL